jgi:triosephosphate isomerase
VIATKIDKTNVMEYMLKADIDGVLIENGSFDRAVDILSEIATHLCD